MSQKEATGLHKLVLDEGCLGGKHGCCHFQSWLCAQQRPTSLILPFFTLMPAVCNSGFGGLGEFSWEFCCLHIARHVHSCETAWEWLRWAGCWGPIREKQQCPNQTCPCKTTLFNYFHIFCFFLSFRFMIFDYSVFLSHLCNVKSTVFFQSTFVWNMYLRKTQSTIMHEDAVLMTELRVSSWCPLMLASTSRPSVCFDSVKNSAVQADVALKKVVILVNS